MPLLSRKIRLFTKVMFIDSRVVGISWKKHPCEAFRSETRESFGKRICFFFLPEGRLMALNRSNPSLTGEVLFWVINSGFLLSECFASFSVSQTKVERLVRLLSQHHDQPSDKVEDT